jgi:hypothetical protein
MPTSGAGQGLLAEDCDGTTVLAHRHRTLNPYGSRVIGHGFVRRYDEVKAEKISGWRPEAVRWLMLVYVVYPRART